MMQPTDKARLRLTAEWLDAKDAARMIGTTAKHLTEELRPYIDHRSRSLTGRRDARGVGYAYSRHALERVAAIEQALGCGPTKAAQHFYVIKRLNELGQLRYMAEALDNQQAPARRRFQ